MDQRYAKKEKQFIHFMFLLFFSQLSCLISYPGLVLMAVGLRISLGAGSYQSLRAELILNFCSLQIISAQYWKIKS